METSSPSRCVLLLCLTVACGGSWLLEQPSSSVMGSYFRMEWLCEAMKATQLKWEINILSYHDIQDFYIYLIGKPCTLIYISKPL